MRPGLGEVVVQQRPLEEVSCARICFEEAEQPPDRAGDDENVAIHAQDVFAVGLLEYHVPHRRAGSGGGRHVAVVRNERIELLEGRGAAAVGMIVDDHEIGVVEDFRVIEPQRLHGTPS